MHDMFPRTLDDIKIQPGRTIYGRVVGLFVAADRGFVTRAVDRFDVTFEGISGDFHHGATRRSGGREPWYARGTEIHNERQLSIVAPDEMAEISERMALADLRPEWIGANLMMEGVPHLSMLPAGTLMFFRHGVTLKVDGQNHPCKLAGRSIGEQADMEDIHGASLLFPKVAKRRRGIVAWVEKPGTIETGETVSLRLPEQWIY